MITLRNKKASNFQVWIEVMLFSVLFVVVLAVIANNMNDLQGDSKDLTFGIVTNDTMDDLKDTQESMDSAMEEGQSSISSFGIFTLTTLPRMIMTTLNMTIHFVTGGWIKSLVNLMNLGDYSNAVITIFQILYFLIIIFILIKIITRVVL